jgi:hypothetical protein
MRDYLNGILSFIGAESLTDEEFSTVSVSDENDDLAVYNSLLTVLQARDLVSDTTLRLQFYFQAKGTEVNPPENARSNIFIGGEI